MSCSKMKNSLMTVFVVWTNNTKSNVLWCVKSDTILKISKSYGLTNQDIRRHLWQIVMGETTIEAEANDECKI